MTDLHRRCQSWMLLLPLLWLLLPLSAAADVVDAINAVRDYGCDGHGGRLPPLRENARLDEVAHYLSQGTVLRSALQAANYHAASSFSVSISAVPPSGDVERIIAQQFCQQTTNAAFREIGSWRRGSSVWIALAEPFTPPASSQGAAISKRALELVNRARSRAQRCGSTPFAAAPALTLDVTLEQVALRYARQMALYGYMDHTGHDGSTPAERVTRSGYRWREMGENLASGIMTPEEVINGWLHSPEHCANLMDPLFRQMGIAFAINPHNETGIYWALEFGTPP